MEQNEVAPAVNPPFVNKKETELTEKVRSLKLSSDVRARGSYLRLLLGMIVFALTIAGGYYAYKNYSPPVVLSEVEQESSTPSLSGKESGGEQTVFKPAVPEIALASSGNLALESKGYIIPTRQILVSPKVSGMILRLTIEEGMRIQKGDVIAELETTEYKADFDRSQAALDSARHQLEELEAGFRPEEIEQATAELGEAQAELDRTESDFQRNAELFRRKVISKEIYDQSFSQNHAAQQRVQRLRLAVKLIREGPRTEKIAAARSQVALAEAELRKARWRLENCTIVAPITGTILKKNAEEGNIVNPIAFNGSFSICEIANLADLEVELMIQERDISRIFIQQECMIRAEAFPEREYKGVVSRIMPIADRAKGAVPVRVKLTIPSEEEGIYLKPEMGALVSFLKESPRR